MFINIRFMQKTVKNTARFGILFNEEVIQIIKRCEWVTKEELYIEYHDKEWGVPVYDDRKLFEMLCLEGAQAGLSWWTILKKEKTIKKLLIILRLKRL